MVPAVSVPGFCMKRHHFCRTYLLFTLKVEQGCSFEHNISAGISVNSFDSQEDVKESEHVPRGLGHIEEERPVIQLRKWLTQF